MLLRCTLRAEEITNVAFLSKVVNNAPLTHGHTEKRQMLKSTVLFITLGLRVSEA